MQYVWHERYAMSSLLFWLMALNISCGVSLGFAVGYQIGKQQHIVVEEYVAARLGTREYHRQECIDAQNITDPLVFYSEAEAIRKGYRPHYCVTGDHLIMIDKEIKQR